MKIYHAGFLTFEFISFPSRQSFVTGTRPFSALLAIARAAYACERPFVGKQRACPSPFAGHKRYRRGYQFQRFAYDFHSYSVFMSNISIARPDRRGTVPGIGLREFARDTSVSRGLRPVMYFLSHGPVADREKSEIRRTETRHGRELFPELSSIRTLDARDDQNAYANVFHRYFRRARNTKF